MEKTSFRRGMEKSADARAAAAGGTAHPVAAGLLSDKGKGWQTFFGSSAGNIVGSALGGLAGKRMSKNPASLGIGTALGGMAGGGIGAYLAHGRNKKNKKKGVSIVKTNKDNSLRK